MNVKTQALMATAASLGLAMLWQGGSTAAVTAIVAAILSVAFAAQCLRDRQTQREVYRPVYIRPATVHRRVRYDD